MCKSPERRNAGTPERRNAGTPELIVPQWDRQSRRLLFGGAIVLELHHSACNQELIMLAFEEQAWLPRIDDPLPRKPGRCPKQRLRDTVRNLNRRTQWIKFHADGTGRGIRWTVELRHRMRYPTSTPQRR